MPGHLGENDNTSMSTIVTAADARLSMGDTVRSRHSQIILSERRTP